MKFVDVNIITKVGGCERHHFVEVVAEVPDHPVHDRRAPHLQLDVAEGGGGRVHNVHTNLPINPDLEHILHSFVGEDKTLSSIDIKPYLLGGFAITPLCGKC